MRLGRVMKCRVCLLDVPTDLQAEHLAAHRAPDGGFLFFYEGREFRTDQPSMLVGELLRLVGGNATYQFHEERDGQHISLSHDNAVDLTREPRFYSVPSATY